MMPCPCCGTPTPALERIQPLGIQLHLHEPLLILWRCPGAREIDKQLLRFGIITNAPWSCQAPRSIRWEHATQNLRHLAFEQERLFLTLNGWI